MYRSIVYILLFSLLTFPGKAQNEQPTNANWWPLQKAPRSIVTCSISKPSDLAEMNLAQSISGLAAQALNENRGEEGVWIYYSNDNYVDYYASLVKRIQVKNTGTYTVWELVKRYSKKGIIDGYVLYDCKSNNNTINLATIYAGVKKSVLIDIEQEKKAIALGLVKQEDVRGRSLDKELFDELRGQLNPALLVLANPQASNNRDYAIAHKSMVYYGVDSLLENILSWVQPLSPVIGWNKGDEFKHIEPCTRWGLINTVSDFCMNLPLLSIRTKDPLPKIRALDPATINFSKQSNYQSFVMSDGDNMQWTSNQFINSKDYWANAANSKLSMGFTSCLLNLSMASRDVYKKLLATQQPGVSLVEYGGGYYYPDLFAIARPNREELVRKFAAIINVKMKETGTSVFGVICKNLASERAKEMYRVFAEEIEDLSGIIAVQYSPYNGGNGKIYWVKNKKGISIPVITARYQLWANQHRKNSGSPADIAGYINTDTTAGTGEWGWTIVHAWSRFDKDASGSFDDIKKGEKKGERGVTPVKWTSELLSDRTTVVSIEELIWRIRMKNNRQETESVINKNK